MIVGKDQAKHRPQETQTASQKKEGPPVLELRSDAPYKSFM